MEAKVSEDIRAARELAHAIQFVVFKARDRDVGLAALIRLVRAIYAHPDRFPGELKKT